MLNNHAPVVSILKSGTIEVKSDKNIDSENISDRIKANGNSFTLEINSGTIELKDNKAIVLVD